MDGIFDFLARIWERVYEWAISPVLRALYQAPKIHVDVTMKSVNVVKATLHHNFCFLQLGLDDDARNAGFAIFLTLREAPRMAGTLEFVQLIIPNRTRSPGPNGSDQIRTSGGERVLDGGDPYKGKRKQITPQTPAGEDFTINDTPGSACVKYLPTGQATGAYEKVSADDKFRVFVMWKPSGGVMAGRRISLGYVDWFWAGEAEIVNDNEDCSCIANTAANITGKWKLTTQPGAYGNTKKYPSMYHQPKYSKTVEDVPWRDL